MIDQGALKLIVSQSWQQLTTGWAHGKKVLRNTRKNIIFPSNPHLNVRYLSKILNLTTDMTSKWVTYRLRYRKYWTVTRTRVRQLEFNLIHNSHEYLAKRSQIQEY